MCLDMRCNNWSVCIALSTEAGSKKLKFWVTSTCNECCRQMVLHWRRFAYFSFFLCNTLTLWSAHLQAFFLWSSVPTLLKNMGLNLFTAWNCKYKSANYSNYDDDVFVLFWFSIFVVHNQDLAKSKIQDIYFMERDEGSSPKLSSRCGCIL
jgi:hypothetical protein